MNRYHLFIVKVLLVVLISGCSRKKDTFINRNYHAVTAEYNTLYNGELALENGREQVSATYQENFWQVLPVERMQLSGEIVMAGTVKNEYFRVAEEKAAKAIQRHSMLIQGNEKNPQIDEAYLLLGKARYYEQRFIPALEAFNYILQKYPASNTIDHARIWREKTNIRLENEQLAIKNLKRILKSENLQDQDRADANAMLAQAYINLGNLDSAAVSIKTAARLTDKNKEKGRYFFIEGQLLNKLEKREAANLAFDNVIGLNRKTPREYFINAHLEKIRNFDYSTGKAPALLVELEEMETNPENRPFLDKIYFQMAEYHYHLDSLDLAIANYNRSLRTLSSDNFLNSVSYESLGDIYFDKTDYRMAGAYFDSTLTKLPVNSKDYFFIKRKRENLQEVIHYEQIAEKNDSILELVAMTGQERVAYFSTFTEALKTEAIAKAKKGEIPQTPVPEINRSPGAPPAIGSPVTGNNFYFYNPSRVASGMQQFLKLWGSRKLQDRWRLESGTTQNAREDELDEVSELIIASNPKFDPATYIEQIPTDPIVIEKLTADRDEAYYKLGLIYKEKYGEYELASEKFYDLLENASEERFIAPAHYHLFQINYETGDYFQSEIHKQYILVNFPDSRYSLALKNPEKAGKTKDAAETKYYELYKLFEEGEYAKVLELSSKNLEIFQSDELLPKFELLKAMALGRLKGYDAYKEALNEVALNYPQTEEGKKAQQLLDTALPNMAETSFRQTSGGENIKLLYSFSYGEKSKAEELKEKIATAIANRDQNWSASVDVYNSEKIFLVIHGITDKAAAANFADSLRDRKYAIDQTPVIISSENYRVVQLHKNFEKYVEHNNNQ